MIIQDLYPTMDASQSAFQELLTGKFKKKTVLDKGEEKTVSLKKQQHGEHNVQIQIKIKIRYKKIKRMQEKKV